MVGRDERVRPGRLRCRGQTVREETLAASPELERYYGEEYEKQLYG